MNTNIYILMLILLIALQQSQVYPQSIKKIESNPDILWGKGEDKDYKQANKLAMEDFINNISVRVESSFEYIAEETGTDFKEYTKSVIKTYSSNTLTRVPKLVKEKRGMVTVLRYLPISNIDSIFLQREYEIKNYAKIAYNAEKELRIGDALMNYYWSYALLLSHYQHNTIKMNFAEMGEMLMEPMLRDKINSIFSGIDFIIDTAIIHYSKNENKKTIPLEIEYKNVPVENLDYKYYTGYSDYSSLIGTVNGKTDIVLYDAAASSLDEIFVLIEYKYLNKSHYSNELEEVLNNIPIPFFKKSQISLIIPKATSKEAYIDSDPKGASIFVNGKEMGLTPLRTKLDFGKHSILIRKDTYLDFITEIEIAETINNFVFSLISTRQLQDMIFVEAGCFNMGSDVENSDKTPINEICLNGFYISQYEITNQQYCDFLNDIKCNSSGYINDVEYFEIKNEYCQIEYIENQFIPIKDKKDFPVFLVSWFGANSYCEWADGRLPTEAEWEFAARGGVNSNGYIYSGSNDIEQVSWYNDNSREHTHHVGTKMQNELGIFDMSGNVWEWCNDWYDENYYKEIPLRNPTGPVSGIGKVLRGGSWGSIPSIIKVSERERENPYSLLLSVGFRLVRDH